METNWRKNRPTCMTEPSRNASVCMCMHACVCIGGGIPREYPCVCKHSLGFSLGFSNREFSTELRNAAILYIALCMPIGDGKHRTYTRIHTCNFKYVNYVSCACIKQAMLRQYIDYYYKCLLSSHA